MKEKLKEHIQILFADAERRSPGNRQLAELKEELLLNTLEKYDHMVETGRTPETAYALAVNGIGDIEELLNDVIGRNPIARTACEAKPADTHANPAFGDKDPEENRESGEADEDGDGDEDDEDDDEENGNGKRPPRSRWYALVSGIIWTVILGSYFALSFTTHAWSTTWLLFIMGIAADNVAEGIFDLRR
jgi:hypothetical protein